jgi:hypothetical protein
MDKVRAKQVLDRIDEILRWEERVDQQKDQKFAELGNTCVKSETTVTGGWVMGVSRNSLKPSSPTPGARLTT